MNKQNEFVEIAGSYGQYWKNGLSLTFNLKANENPNVRSIFKLVVEVQDCDTRNLTQSMIDEINNTKEYFEQASNKYHLCATLEAINNIVSSYTEDKDALFIENNDEIIGNWW